MTLPKILLPALRGTQILLATIVLGLTGYFLHHRHKFNKTNDEPFERLVFSIVLSSSSLTHALSSLLTSHPPSVPAIALDILFATGYFTIFALLIDSYADNLACQSLYSWVNPGVWRDTCAQWNAA